MKVQNRKKHGNTMYFGHFRKVESYMILSGMKGASFYVLYDD